MTENSANLKYFFWRRLHSLVGIVPIGAFLLEHFYSNSYAFKGAAPFNEMVATLQGIPIVIVIEICVIILPILFHAGLGLAILYASKQNVFQYGTYRNWMYFLQRITGVFALIFVSFHVYETRVKAALEGRLVTYDFMQHYFSSGGVKIFYIVGMVSVLFHFANGIATSLITWGITVSKRSQEVAAAASWVLFFVMTVWGMKILYAFR